MLNFKSANIIIAVVVVLIVAGGIYWWYQSPSHQISKNESDLEKLKIEKLKLDLALSPLPDLNLSSFGLDVPQLSGLNIFSGVAVNSDFSYKGETKLSAPSYDLSVSVSDVPVSSSAPSSTGAPAVTGPPASTPTPTSGSQSGQSTDCSQFASVPSCSMVGGGQAYDLCKQCWPSK